MKQTILPTRDYLVNTGPGNAEKGLHDEKALKVIQLIFNEKGLGNQQAMKVIQLIFYEKELRDQKAMNVIHKLILKHPVSIFFVSLLSDIFIKMYKPCTQFFITWLSDLFLLYGLWCQQWKIWNHLNNSSSARPPWGSGLMR